MRLAGEPALAALASSKTDGEDVTGNAVLFSGRARKNRKNAMEGRVTWANILLALLCVRRNWCAAQVIDRRWVVQV